MPSLETLRSKFNHLPLNALRFAAKDIKETLDIWKDEDTEYTRKLWAEWDHVICLIQKREGAA